MLHWVAIRFVFQMLRILKLFLLLFMVSIAMPIMAASIMDGFTDPEDDMFDVSHWLAEKKGFIPVPIIIAKLAIGYGAGAALIFLHDPLAGHTPDGETFDSQSKDAEG